MVAIIISLGHDAHGNTSFKTFFAIKKKHMGRPMGDGGSWVLFQLMLLKQFIVSGEF